MKLLIVSSIFFTIPEATELFISENMIDSRSDHLFLMERTLFSKKSCAFSNTYPASITFLQCYSNAVQAQENTPGDLRPEFARNWSKASRRRFSSADVTAICSTGTIRNMASRTKLLCRGNIFRKTRMAVHLKRQLPRNPVA